MQGLQLMPRQPAGSRRRLSDRRGAVAVIFGLSVVPLAMTVGLASDYSVYVKVQSQLNLAADTAAMQAVRVASEVNGSKMSPSDFQSAVQTAGQQAGQQWFKAQMGNLVNGVVPDGNVVVNVTYNPMGSRFTSNVSYTSRLPSFSDCTEHLCEDRLSGQHEAELFDEWPQSDCGHVGDEFVEHAA